MPYIIKSQKMEITPAVPRVRARIIAAHIMNSDFSELANFPRTNADGAKDNGIPASVFLDQLPESISKKYYQEPHSWILKLKGTLSEDERAIVRQAVLNMPPKKDGENGYPMPWCTPFDGCRGAWEYDIPKNTMKMLKIHRADIEALNEIVEEIQNKSNSYNKEKEYINTLFSGLDNQQKTLNELQNENAFLRKEIKYLVDKFHLQEEQTKNKNLCEDPVAEPPPALVGVPSKRWCVPWF